jgi:hypothetical protein
MHRDSGSPGDKHRLSGRTLLILASVLVVMGAGWTLGSAIWALVNWRFVANAVTASGVVTGISQGAVTCPQVRFRLRDGSNRTFTDQSSCATPSRYPVNSTVPILYDPAAPDHAAIHSFDALWMGIVVMGAMGLISLVIGVECFTVRRHRLLREPVAHSFSGPSRNQIYPPLMMIAGLIMAITTVPWTLNKRSFVAAAASASGVVVGQVYHPAVGRYGSSEYCPKVQFQTRTGNDIVFVDTTGCNKPPAFPDNMTVTVLYDATYPQNATIQSFRTLWLPEVGLASVGALFFILGALWRRSIRKRMGY